MSQINPNAHSELRHGALRTRSGRDHRDTIAFTPGMHQLSSAIRMLNQIVDTRFSLPSGGAMDFGSNAMFCRIGRTPQTPTAVRIAFSGARSRSLTSPNHLGSCRSMLHASEIRLIRVIYTGQSRNGQSVAATLTNSQIGHSPGWEMAAASGRAVPLPHRRLQ